MTTMKGDYFNVEKNLISVEECLTIKKSFYACVLEKKSQLTQSLPNDQWRTYLNQVDNIQLECASETQVKNCSNYFSFYDINY
jgi:hypothetical protein